MRTLWLAFLAALVAFPVAAQTYATITVQVTDPVLKPSGNHRIDREASVWDGRANCAPMVAAPLVMVFHGGAGDPSSMKAMFPPQGCAVVAYVAGSDKRSGTIYYRVTHTNLSWNAYAVPEQGWSGVNGVDENQFLLALKSKLVAQYGTTRTYGVGLSKGGMLVHHAACDLGLFEAIATVAATIADPTCTPAVKAPLHHTHGLADTRVCWEFTGTSCNPWPVAKPGIEAWQATGGPHVLTLLPGVVHGWPAGTTAAIWAWLAGL